MRSWVSACSCALVLLLAWSTVAAQEGDDKARALALYRAGSRSYNLADYKDALESFRQAYKLSGDPVFLFNVAQCQRQLGDAAAAASSYRAFLRSKPNAPNRADVEQRIADMDKMVAAQQAQKPPSNVEPPPNAPPPPTVTPVAPTAPPPAPLVFEKEPERPWFKRPLVWGLVGAGVVAVAVAVVLGVVLGGGATDPTPTIGAVRGWN